MYNLTVSAKLLHPICHEALDFSFVETVLSQYLFPIQRPKIRAKLKYVPNHNIFFSKKNQKKSEHTFEIFDCN